MPNQIPTALSIALHTIVGPIIAAVFVIMAIGPREPSSQGAGAAPPQRAHAAAMGPTPEPARAVSRPSTHKPQAPIPAPAAVCSKRTKTVRDTEPPAVFVVNDSRWLGVVDVRRSELRSLLDTQQGLSGHPRILAYHHDGSPIGVKLYGIRQASLFRAAGFRNGDIVHTINGHPVMELDTLMSLPLESQQFFDIELTRRGQPARIVVLIHEDET